MNVMSGTVVCIEGAAGGEWEVCMNIRRTRRIEERCSKCMRQ
jgi:hypothetical protein